MTRTRGLLVIGVTACTLMNGVARAQAGRAEEINQIRSEISRLAARLDKLEAEEGTASGRRVSSRAEPAPSVAPGAAQGPAPTLASYQIPEVLSRDPQLALGPSDIAALNNRTLAGATLDRALQPDGAAFELSATSDASSVAIKVARSESEAGDDTGVFTTMALTASAPLASSGRFSDLGTLDGFVGGSRLRLQLSRYERRISEPDLHPAFEALVETTKAACRARLGAAAKECSPDLFSSQFVHDYAPELETALLAMARMTTGPNPRVDWSARAYGLELSVGYKKFDFLETGPARKSDASRVPLSGKLFLSYLPDVRRNAITAGIEYQRTFKDSSSGALCPVATPGSELRCFNGPIGEPKRNEKLLLSGEYRQKIVFGEYSFVPSIGISALATYDALNDDLGIDVPVYLVNDAKSGLTGGVRFGYTTSEKNFIAGVFVGTAFSLR